MQIVKWTVLLMVVWVSLWMVGCGSDYMENPPADGDSVVDGDTDGDVDVEGEVELDESDGDEADGDEPDGDLDEDHDIAEEESDGDLDADSDAEEEVEAEEDGPDLPVLDLVEDCNPFAFTDVCLPPFPSIFFEREDADSPTGIRGDYPDDALPNWSGRYFFNTDYADLADGISPASPIIVHFGVDVNPDQLTAQRELAESLATDNPIQLYDMETGKRVLFMSEMDANRDEERPGRYALIIRPLEPMAMGHRHAVVLTNDLTDDEGNAFDSPEAFEVLRDGVITANEPIERVRDDFDTLFTFLEGKQVMREDLLVAWSFQVASEDWLLGPVKHMRSEALTAFDAEGFGYTIEEVQDDPNDSTARLVKGVFQVPTYLTDDQDLDFDVNHVPQRQTEDWEFPFTVVIPKKARTLAEPLPLLVFGHGIFGSGRSYLAGWGTNVIQPLAEEYGVVMIATDWIGLSAADEDIIVDEIIGDLNRIGVVTDRLVQSLINNLTMTEMMLQDLQYNNQVKIGENDLIDTSRVYYYGVSLGGIMGSSFVSLSNRITRGVLAVPGCAWANMLPRSTVWNPIATFFDLEYPDPLVRQMGMVFMQMRFDHSDPINLTQMLYANPPADAPAGKRVILQESIGDSQVPNLTTEMLARGIGLKLMTPSVFGVEGLESVTSPTTESVLAQYHMVDQEQANPPPQTNIPPASDNGVHSDMVFLDNVLDQIGVFMETGNIEQYCTDSCDPD